MIAVPGSGKTRVIVERTVRLIQSGVKPEEIISLTFTNKAGREMKERVLKRLGVGKIKTYMGTFHSFCALMMRRYAKHRGYTSDFSILDDGDQRSFIKKVAKELYPEDYDRINPHVVAWAVNTVREELGDLENEIPKFLAVKIGDSEVSLMAAKVGLEYLQRTRKNNVIDFSGLLYEAIMVMEETPSVLEFMQNCHKYLQVDEVQDTNFAQFRFVELLSGKHHNVFCGGDLSQSVYRFRGARIQNIHDFIKHHKSKVLELSFNYRSTPQIVAAADKLIRHNQSHMIKVFATNNPPGDPVKVVGYDRTEDEAKAIAQQISSWLYTKKYRPHDIVVLYRINALSRVLEDAFRQKAIPYKIVGGFSFYERAEIKDAIAMLKLMVNPNDMVAFSRLANVMHGMGDKTISLIEDTAKEHSIGFISAISKISPQIPKQARHSCQEIVKVYGGDHQKLNAGQALVFLLDAFHYDEHLIKQDPVKYHERVDNLEELRLSAMSNGNENLSISEYLQGIMLLSSGDEEDDDKNRVTLMTMHASKGLEYPIVFIVGAEVGLIPHERALAEEGGEEEERRLMYVAMTRAKKNLYVTFCRVREKVQGKNKRLLRVSPSPFLVEAGLIEKNMPEPDYADWN